MGLYVRVTYLSCDWERYMYPPGSEITEWNHRSGTKQVGAYLVRMYVHLVLLPTHHPH